MTLPVVVTAVIIGLLLAELRVSRRHERALIARGALAPTGDVYGPMAVGYPAAFLVMGAEGAWRATSGAPAIADVTAVEPAWFVSGLLMFVAAKGLKYWAIATLGDRWTFKVLVVPRTPLRTDGPYRYLAHPNYLGVMGELVGAAMMVGAPVSGPIGCAGFALLLWMRIRFETRAHAAAGVS